ncbi:hypothetical protein B4U80_01179 [Leptotrombidium deliense]|uniref:Uncharacterized protein n=1 Tax=Leptotrombidium deliense TaxID=299467 RepID=A0A443SVC8_9ACAR|nr:hypothetical protein B4U80_01179 [Leptotrombidium deliense]
MGRRRLCENRLESGSAAIQHRWTPTEQEGNHLKHSLEIIVEEAMNICEHRSHLRLEFACKANTANTYLHVYIKLSDK